MITVYSRSSRRLKSVVSYLLYRKQTELLYDTNRQKTRSGFVDKKWEAPYN